MKPETPAPGLLFGSFLYRKDIFDLSSLKERWESVYGAGFQYVPQFNPLTEYYASEMGNELERVFFLTSRAYPREYLLSAKLLSLDWEDEWRLKERRMVNVDIGFLSLENFFLATTKNYSHRLYLGQNIFGDLTYHFHQGAFQVLPWTYPDYVDPQKIEFFTWGRGYLLQNYQS